MSGQVWAFYQAVAPRHKVPLEELVAGLPIGVADLARAQRFDWDLFVEINERLGRAIGLDMLEREMADSVGWAPTFEPLRRVGGWVLSPRLLYGLAVRMLPRFVFGPVVDVAMDDTAAGQLAFEVGIRAAYRASTAFMHLVRGALHGLPEIVGLARAVIEGELAARRSRLVVQLPRSRLGARLWGMRRAVNPFSELARQREALAEAEIASAEATRHGHGLLRTLIDSVDEMIMIVDEQGRVRFSNDALARTLGSATSLAEIVHPDDRARMAALFVGGGDHPVDVRLRDAGGAYRTLEMSARDLRDDPVISGVLVHGRDVTERRSAEAQQLAKERQYAIFLRNLSGVAYRARRSDGVLELVSEQCGALLGYTVDELVGTKASALIHPDDLEGLRARRRPQIAARQPSTDEFRFRVRSGEYRWMLDNAHGVFDEAGELVAIEGFITDITARKRLEEQLAHAQRLEGLGRLAGGIAHDFNNLLGAMLGYTSLVKKDVPPGSEAAEDLAALEDTVRRAAALTGKMLAVARRQVIRPRVLDPNELVLGMDKLLRRTLGADVELSTVTAHEVWPVEADPGQLEQVLLNLAVNARDAMPEGGSLTIETGNVVVEQDGGELPAGAYAQIAVTDTGVGMTDAVMRHAFEPFFTTKPQGTGLGLATSFGIVNQARGRLTVESAPARGTTFRIWLPRTLAPLPRPPEVSPVPPARAGETVLLVEDHAVLRNVAARSLEEAGYRVVAAANGAEALAVAARMPAIDILVTDMVMPGMPGTVLAERLLVERPGLPVLFVSGYSDTPAAPDTHFLAKPFTPATLAAKVREVLDRRAGER